MDGGFNTDSLRSLATHWTLAGDDQLLKILQNTHKKIVSKCDEVNSKLDEMSLALDDASINLQNVNNKFMGLSNSQFIESRVYDDDELITEQIPSDKEKSSHSQMSQAEMIKKSLLILEGMHETVTILRDSDTESDSEEEEIARIVLKPKDLYKHRPLPHIIGSEAWKNKWHAGLLVEDSDTDSCTSKHENRTPEYSESENDEDLSAPKKPDENIYSKEERFVKNETPPEEEMSPNDIAAELARRLAGQTPQVSIPEHEEEYSPPRPAVKTVYKPQQPPTGVIFTDEPPTLEEYDPQSYQDEDIFAELHRNQPYSKNEDLGNNLADDLFGVARGDGFSGSNNKVTKPKVVPRTSSIEHEENFKKNDNEDVLDNANKKPVGGISMFGSSNNADSIGAAILKRNARKQSNSGDESDNEPLNVRHAEQTDTVKKEKDIIDGLFAKPKNIEKNKGIIKINKTQAVKEEKTIETKAKEKIDLFSDNIFDDIDDIFTNNVVKVSKTDSKVNKQSLFDDDVDLFADIQISSTKDSNKNVSKETKSLFDSDDDLFKENSPKSTIESQNNRVGACNLVDTQKLETKSKDLFRKVDSNIEILKQTNKTSDSKAVIGVKSIFDSDSDSDIFSSVSSSKPKVNESLLPKPKENPKTPVFETDKIINSQTNKISPTTTQTENIQKIESDIKNINPSLFDKDNDGVGRDIASETQIQDASKPIIKEKPSSIPEASKMLPNENKAERVFDTYEAPILENSEKEHVIAKIDKINSIDEKETLSQGEYDSISNKDVFSDILIEPPVFEKPKEPKRSKNVNALFDDDSDDETLFFKKSDVIEDVSQDFSSDVNHDALFGIFHDEPPAIDIEPPEQYDTLNEDTTGGDTKLHNSQNVFNKTVSNATRIPETPSPITKSDDFLQDRDVFSTIDDEYIFTGTKNTQPSNRFCNNSQNVFDKIVSNTTHIPETPSPIAKYDNHENNDIFSAIDSENVISKIKEIEVTNRVDEDDFDIFNSPDNSGVQEETPDINNQDLFKTHTKKNKILNDKLIDHDNLTNNTEKSKDVFNSLKINSKLKRRPVVSDFDDSDDELFKPLSSFENSNKILKSSQSESPAIDKNIKAKIDKQELNTTNITQNKNKTLEFVLKNETIIPESKESEIIETISDVVKPNVIKTEDSVDTALDKDINKVRKLKNINFNIDVETLLPGASPKKNKIQSVTKEFKKEKTNVKNENNDVKNDQATIVKSVSFESDPNSDILDNKLTKERAKVQVKRRPSTRKARREAVRKSAIDLDDSTDNSNSIDDIPKATTDFKNKPNTSKVVDKNDTILPKTFETDLKNDPIEVIEREGPNDNRDLSKIVENSKEVEKKQETKVTKIVYILNDDDIFSTPSKMADFDNKNKGGNINSTFESTAERLGYKEGIKTFGEGYKKSENNDKETRVIKDDKKSSLFYDESDDELFQKNKKVVKKSSIFDSDSEEDLFTNKKKEGIKKIEVKSSLFGDEDNGDDLFAVKNKNTDTKMRVPKLHASTEITTEPVFDDPLSILEED